MVRNDDGIGAGLHREQGVINIIYALEDELAMPLLADEFHRRPIQRWIKLVMGPLRQCAHVLHAFDMAHDVSEGAVFGAQHAHAPTRLGHHVEDIGDGQFGRRGQAVPDVLVALAEKLEIEGEHEG